MTPGAPLLLPRPAGLLGCGELQEVGDGGRGLLQAAASRSASCGKALWRPSLKAAAAAATGGGDDEGRSAAWWLEEVRGSPAASTDVATLASFRSGHLLLSSCDASPPPAPVGSWNLTAGFARLLLPLLLPALPAFVTVMAASRATDSPSKSTTLPPACAPASASLPPPLLPPLLPLPAALRAASDSCHCT